jgi:outer membrane protein assembly factor BamB
LVDGVKLWSLDVMAETSANAPGWGCASAPVFMGDLIYLQGGESGPAVVAIDKIKHAIAWQSEETDPASYSAIVPVTFKGKTQLLAYAGKGVLALDPATGKTLWKQPLKNPNETTACGVSPLVRDGRMFLAFGYGKGAAMFKVDGQSSDLLWEKEELGNRTVPPLLEGDCLYVHHDDFLVCLQWPDGKEVWKTDLGLGGGGQYVRAGEKMIMLAHTGELLLAEVTPAECDLISKIKLFEGTENLATPLVYRGRLYVKGPSDLVCFDIKNNAR